MTDAEESRLPNPIPRHWSDVAADACSLLGCLGWILIGPLLDRCDQSEQLARFFAALTNLIMLSVVGGTSTVLCLLGLYWSRGTATRSSFRTTRLGRIAAYAGLTVGAFVLLIHAPMLVRYLC